MPEPTPLEPALHDAEQLLRDSLTEVCRTDPAAADTGEMIRLDEMLAIAGEAAKKAVSLRRRMRQEDRGTSRAGKAGSRRRGATAEGPAVPGPADRKPAATKAAAAPPTPPKATVSDTPVPPAPPAIEPPPGDALTSSGSHSLESEASLVSQAASEHRTFRDTHGVTWSVWAVHPQSTTRRAGLRGTFVQGWLAFVCEAEKRRLSPVPEGWMQYEDAELERLCRTAEVAKPEAATRRMPPIKGEG